MRQTEKLVTQAMIRPHVLNTEDMNWLLIAKASFLFFSKTFQTMQLNLDV